MYIFIGQVGLNILSGSLSLAAAWNAIELPKKGYDISASGITFGVLGMIYSFAILGMGSSAEYCDRPDNGGIVVWAIATGACAANSVIS
jgi:hypothetical protein